MKKSKIFTLVAMLALLICATLCLASCDFGPAHEYSYTYSYDDDNHWYECTYENCDAKADVEAHDLEKVYEEEDGRTYASYECTVCDYSSARTEVATPADETALAAAIANGGEVLISSPITVSAPITVAKDTVITLLSAATLSDDSSALIDGSTVDSARMFNVASGASLTINAEGAEVVMGGYGLVEFPADTVNASVVINGGTYTGSTANGALVRLRAGNDGIKVTLNDVTVSCTDTYSVISTEGVTVEDCLTLEVNGGYFNTGKNGFELYSTNGSINDATIIANGEFAILSGSGDVVVNDTDISYTSGGVSDYGVTAAVAASGDGYLTVNGGKITVTYDSAMGANPQNIVAALICNSGGTLALESVEIDTTSHKDIKLYRVDSYGDGEVFKLTVNGIDPYDTESEKELVTNETDLSDALTSGGDVVLAGKVETTDKLIMNGGTLDGNGQTIDGSDYYADNYNNSSDCAITTTGGTVQNVTIENAFRGLGSGSSGDYEMTEDLYIDNVTVDKGTYALNVGIGNSYAVEISNSTLYGWMSCSGVSYTKYVNCTLGTSDTSYLGYIVVYEDLIFEGCTFEDSYLGGNADLITPGKYSFRSEDYYKTVSITLTDCTYNGVQVTAENFTSLFVYPDDSDFELLRDCNITVDGEPVIW